MFNKWFSLFVLLTLASCSDRTFGTLCAEHNERSCVVGEGGLVYVDGKDYFRIEEFHNKGECKTGKVSCTSTKLLCEGFVGPVFEECNGVDDDCDGFVDEDFDKDGDGWTSCDSRGFDCWDDPQNPPPEMSHLSPELAKDFNHESSEICDGLDNNCNCWLSNDPDSNNDGLICACSPDPNCLENCCDLNVDEKLYPVSCYEGFVSLSSRCKVGKKFCENGKMSECKGSQKPEQEICNGIDDDCNGNVDDNLESFPCGYNQVGACKLGRTVCLPGNAEMICIDASYPQNEICNGSDDDCDGPIDEDLTRQCRTDCGIGVEFCWFGNWISCTAKQPDPEVCDGIDNDCDGFVDDADNDVDYCQCTEGEISTCKTPPLFDLDTGLPADEPFRTCGSGIQICSIDGEWGPCYFLSPEDAEICNGWDDDCDGIIDGMTRACWTHPDPAIVPTSVGECALGVMTCDTGIWGSENTEGQFVPGLCAGEAWPTEEICDGEDNDCDSFVDEDMTLRDKVDMLFLVDGSGSMYQLIDNLRSAIGIYSNDFRNTHCPAGSGNQCHRFGLAVFPGHGGFDCINGPKFLVLSADASGNALVDVDKFHFALSGIPPVCSEEPSYDVLFESMDSTDPMRIGWRQDAFPYVVIITDEAAQSWSGITPNQIGNRSIACGVGGCFPGDSFEVFVITQPAFYSMWDEVIHGDQTRLKDIWGFQNSVQLGVETLREIFQSVCLR